MHACIHPTPCTSVVQKISNTIFVSILLMWPNNERMVQYNISYNPLSNIHKNSILASTVVSTIGHT